MRKNIKCKDKCKMLNKKGGNMDTLNYGGIDAVEMVDLEFDRRIKECKTDEEKDKVIKEYIFKRLLILCAAFAILFIGLAIIVVVVNIFK